MPRPSRLLFILAALGLALLIAALVIAPTITVPGKLAIVGGTLVFVAGMAATYPGWESRP